MGVVVVVVTEGAEALGALGAGWLIPLAVSSLAFLVSLPTVDFAPPLSSSSLASHWPTVARRKELLVASCIQRTWLIKGCKERTDEQASMN